MTHFPAAFMGNRQAGCVGLLTLYAAGITPIAVVAYDDALAQLATILDLPVSSSVHDPEFKQALSDSKLLVSVHGRQIVPNELLDMPTLGGINVHPCLYAYKGADPVGRLLADGNTKASVGVHRMTDALDEGEVLVEEFLMVDGKETVIDIYNALYPIYATALFKALKIMQQKDQP